MKTVIVPPDKHLGSEVITVFIHAATLDNEMRGTLVRRWRVCKAIAHSRGGKSQRANISPYGRCRRCGNVGNACTLIVEIRGKEVWRSRPLRRSERQLAFIDIRGASQITLRSEGARGLLMNWGGAKLTANDPEVRFFAALMVLG